MQRLRADFIALFFSVGFSPLTVAAKTSLLDIPLEELGEVVVTPARTP